jgi:hypothetical protein
MITTMAADTGHDGDRMHRPIGPGCWSWTFGFTGDPGGANLPIELAPWEEAGSVTNPSWLATEVTDAIKRDGFYVMSKT